MFVYANAGDTGVEENFFFTSCIHIYIYTYIYIYTHVVWVGWGGAITFHCTYKLVALDIHHHATLVDVLLHLTLGCGGAITFHCTYKLVALDIRQNQHRGCKDQSIEWRLVELDLPSGKRLHNYGKSPFLMGKSTINSHF